MALLAKPAAPAMAWIVSVELTGMGALNCCAVAEVAGDVPSVVKKIAELGVVSEMVTDCGDEYVPGSGLKVGAATADAVARKPWKSPLASA
jgi:hypothetical protein